MTDEKKQRLRDYQKKYRDNMTDEQKQKKGEADKRYKDKQKERLKEANKQYRDNMSDERKQKLRDYQKGYQKKYYAPKKLNNKITNDKIIDDNDFYCISIIIKNIVPIKDINSILKINKKVCTQAYLEGCNFINDCDNKNEYKIIFLD